MSITRHTLQTSSIPTTSQHSFPRWYARSVTRFRLPMDLYLWVAESVAFLCSFCAPPVLFLLLQKASLYASLAFIVGLWLLVVLLLLSSSSNSPCALPARGEVTRGLASVAEVEQGQWCSAVKSFAVPSFSWLKSTAVRIV
jgi:hypothetical protein